MSIDLKAIRQRADVCLSVAVHTRDQMDRRIEVGPEGVFVHLFADAPIKSSSGRKEWLPATSRGRTFALPLLDIQKMVMRSRP